MEDLSLSDIFSLLWPDFGALWRGELGGINALIILLIIGIGAAFGAYLFRYGRQVTMRLDMLGALVESLKTDELVDTRERVRKAAAGSTDHVIRDVWREFDETLVESPDSKSLWNTLDAEYFFNSNSLASELTQNRLLLAVPSILTAIGVLGTFIGLTTGLNGLELGTDSDIERLKVGIDTLIAGAAIAFMTSVWGVFLSLIANFAEKWVERTVIGKVTSLQRRIDRLYKRHAPEQSLVKIMDSSQESALSLQELHERIGNQLQEAVRGISSDLESALVTAIETAMRPAMASLVDSTSQQSTEVFSQLVDKFSAGFQHVGELQARKLEAASGGVTDAVASMSSQFEAVMAQISESSSAQQQELASRTTQFQSDMTELTRMNAEQRESMNGAVDLLVQQMGAVGTRIADSGDSLERASADLRATSTILKTATDALGSKFSVSTEKLAAIAEQQESAASMFWEYAEKLKALQIDMIGAADSMKQAASSSNEGFEALRSHQTSFLSELRSNFEASSREMSERVAALNSTMTEQLARYRTEVAEQVGERMDLWNRHSQDYANNMLRIADALSAAIDELEGRQVGAAVDAALEVSR
ncbi:anti-phage ZorAB system protein ZorA [Salinibacterium sp. ZJ454]|uniref:anti-phage ZorAB system protein ZorA n=1 Tax=Salinibacterium sp. ZJ454 TaxID=2708339 RepID=UPI00142374BF|nr:anti-phage ZorAB system protein ZorA [Salinibacterium sp. ZJ454]